MVFIEWAMKIVKKNYIYLVNIYFISKLWHLEEYFDGMQVKFRENVKRMLTDNNEDGELDFSAKRLKTEGVIEIMVTYIRWVYFPLNSYIFVCHLTLWLKYILYYVK